MEIPRRWRLKAQRYRLEGSTCPNCGQPILPPRPICPRCTDKAVWIADRIIPASLSLMTLTAVEGQIGYQVTERLIV